MMPAVAVHRLELTGIVKRYGATLALDRVDLAVARGEVHGLLGENGAGKSTLMRILAGAELADAGSMQLDGRPYRPSSAAHGRAAGIAMIYQELALVPHLSVADNIALGREPSTIGWRDRQATRALAQQALQRVGATVAPEALVQDLGAGARQLVEIARALVAQARVLVLDEPTSSLTAPEAEHLFGIVEQLRDEGRSVIFISHNLHDVARLCDRFSVLRDGSLVARGSRAQFDVPAVVEAMVGRTITELYPRSARKPGATVLELTPDLSLRRGEILGLAGLMGSGRTRFLRELFGLAANQAKTLASSVKLAYTPAGRWRQGIGFVSEDRAQEGLALDRSIAENLCLPRLDRLSRHGWLAPAVVQRAAAEWIERFDVRCSSPLQPVRSLSGGNQQKVALARLFMAEVDVLLLDEPTRGIDVAAKSAIYRCMDQAAAGSEDRPGKAILMASSELPELLGLCDRIAVMTHGQLGPARSVAEWDQSKLLRAAANVEASHD